VSVRTPQVIGAVESLLCASTGQAGCLSTTEKPGWPNGPGSGRDWREVGTAITRLDGRLGRRRLRGGPTPSLWRRHDCGRIITQGCERASTDGTRKPIRVPSVDAPSDARG